MYIIIIHHMDDYSGQMFASRIDTIVNYVCLGLFVYLSGYVLARRYQSFLSIADCWTFLKKRFLRIYPLYAIALTLFLILGLTSLNAKSWVFHYLIPVDTLLAPYCVHPIGTLWFISVIVFYYFLFVVIVYYYNNSKLILVSFAVMILLAVTNLFCSTVDKRLIIYLPMFAIGLYVGINNIDKYFENKALLLLSILLFFVMSYCYVYFYISKVKYLIQIAFMILSIIPAIVICKYLDGHLALDKVIKKLSYASFCMYLFHRIVFSLLLTIWTPSSEVLNLCYLFVVGLPITYVAASFIQRRYDIMLYRFCLVDRPRG